MKKSTNSPTQNPKDIFEQRHSFKEEIANLNQDLQTIMQHIKTAGAELTKDASQEVWSRVENVAARVSDINKRISSSVWDFANHQLDKTKEKTQKYVNNLEDTVKEYPIPSVAISLGIGLLISKVFGSWHSSH